MPYRDTRKVDPSSKNATRPDGSPQDNDRVEIGPTQLAFDEWASAGLELPDLGEMRQYRLQRIVSAMEQRDYGAVLLFDPLNIRYATDTTNMQLWNTHNPFRACLVLADGYMVLWEYKGLPFLSEYNPLVREVRGGAGLFYFNSGDRIAQQAKAFVSAVTGLMSEHVGANRRLAVDKIMVAGLRALDNAGITVEEGEEMMEKCRSIKGEQEIRAMRCAVRACEASMHVMEQAAVPGVTENDIWAVLHAENIRRGGEWIETRLLASGPRTNPWFQECGPRVVQNNELVAFDTDLVGCYGMCCDISRTWFVGDGKPTAEQKRLFEESCIQVDNAMHCIEPGKTIGQLVSELRPLPAEFADLRYGCVMHGVGLCDEWPLVKYQNDFQPGEFDYPLEPGMMLCVEAYVGVVGGVDGVKYEEQVLVTDAGYEKLSQYPLDARLSNR